MGKQDHSFPFTGKVGKLSFFRTKNNGHMVREARGISADRIANEANFKITRQNMAEFGRAAKAGKLLRTTLRTV